MRIARYTSTRAKLSSVKARNLNNGDSGVKVNTEVEALRLSYSAEKFLPVRGSTKHKIAQYRLAINMLYTPKQICHSFSNVDQSQSARLNLPTLLIHSKWISSSLHVWHSLHRFTVYNAAYN
ncbi:hypothetical protein J6590_030975 [Homalodisca vitripennis]|nr:hypothetical protein J6590_030975 [Homalodisca vitripennis]